MSGAGVQRAIVRMMFDPAFRDAVYADAAAALAGCDVSEDERGWLVRPDRRAYATDGTRQARALLAIEQELPAACAWARAEGRALEAFFASAELHACIEGRGVLTLAFAAWLRRDARPALDLLAALEAAVATARRATVRTPDRGQVMRSPRVVLVAGFDGALAWWTSVRDAARDGAALPSLPTGDPCAVMVHVDDAGEARAEELPDGLAAVLQHAEAPVARASLEARAIELGLDPPDAIAVIDDLVASALLLG